MRIVGFDGRVAATGDAAVPGVCEVDWAHIAVSPDSSMVAAADGSPPMLIFNGESLTGSGLGMFAREYTEIGGGPESVMTELSTAPLPVDEAKLLSEVVRDAFDFRDDVVTWVPRMLRKPDAVELQ